MPPEKLREQLAYHQASHAVAAGILATAIVVRGRHREASPCGGLGALKEAEQIRQR
jgi:hypothetical protein